VLLTSAFQVCYIISNFLFVCLSAVFPTVTLWNCVQINKQGFTSYVLSSGRQQWQQVGPGLIKLAIFNQVVLQISRYVGVVDADVR